MSTPSFLSRTKKLLATLKESYSRAPGVSLSRLPAILFTELPAFCYRYLIWLMLKELWLALIKVAALFNPKGLRGVFDRKSFM